MLQIEQKNNGNVDIWYMDHKSDESIRVCTSRMGRLRQTLSPELLKRVSALVGELNQAIGNS